MSRYVPRHARADRPGGWRALAREPWRTLLVAAPLATAGLALAPWFRAGIGLDGLAYVSIAQQWAEGGQPVNGYWGPLWSWLLVPLLAVGVEPLLAATVVQVASAVLVLVALRRLAAVLGVGPAARDVIALAVTPFLLATAHYGVFVDVLLSGLLLLWCAEVLRGDLSTDRAVAVRAGLWAGLAVLTKIYALPFVVVHLAVVAGLHLLRRRGERGGFRQVLGASALTLAVVGLLFVPWVAALSATYDRFTVTKSARYNVTIAGPGSQGNPIRYAGLLRPPSEAALSVWEDPSSMPLDADGWGAGGESASRLVDNVTDNLRLGAELIDDDMVVVTALGIAGALLVLVPRRRARAGRRPDRAERTAMAGLVAAAAIYAGGYLVLFVERRYTWFVLLLAAVPAALVLDRLLDRVTGRGRGAALVGVTLVLGATVGAQAWPRLADRVDAGERAQEVAGALRDDGGVEGPVASNGFWERTAVICFELDCQYHGQPRDHELGPGLGELLVERGIRTWVSWGEPTEPAPGPEVTPAGLADVHVYLVEAP